MISWNQVNFLRTYLPAGDQLLWEKMRPRHMFSWVLVQEKTAENERGVGWKAGRRPSRA